MPLNTEPIGPARIITAKQVANARKAVGACNSCAEKIEAFKVAGIEFPDEEQMNEDIRQKASALLTAAELYETYGSGRNGNGPTG